MEVSIARPAELCPRWEGLNGSNSHRQQVAVRKRSLITQVGQRICTLIWLRGPSLLGWSVAPLIAAGIAAVQKSSELCQERLFK